MDPLTDIFRIVQVRAAVQCRIEATAPWGLSHSAAVSSTGDVRLDALGISLEEAASFAMISRGSCWLTVDGTPDSILLTAGDCFLVAPGKYYTLRDDPHTPAINLCDAPVLEDNHVVCYGGGGAPTTIIAGLIHFGAASLKSITQLLPELVLIRSEQASNIGLDTIFQLLTTEMTGQQPAYGLVSTRLAEVLFIQALRAQISNSVPTSNPGWLRAIFDPKIGAAMRQFHDAVEQPWTVKSLASAAGMSRSAFALRFKQLLGQSPLEYVTQWRMQKAIQLLGDANRKLADIAQQIGYDSDAAFNKAFKRVIGNTPRGYVRQALSQS
jgi:transcriptional regulator GlxA family with amidase domain